MALLTEVDVQTTVFTPRGFYGHSYDSDEVDEFMDQAANTIGKLGAVVQSLAERNHSLELQLQAARLDAARLRSDQQGSRDE